MVWVWAFGWEVCVQGALWVSVMLWVQAWHPQNTTTTTTLSWMSSPLCLPSFSAANLCLRWGYRVNMVFYQQESDSPQLSTSISLNYTRAQVSCSAVRTHPRKTQTHWGSATHKAVNNRKWYVAEKVSAQLDSANTALFFIFSVHVDMSSIFSARLEVFTPSKGFLSGWCLWLCIFPLLLTRRALLSSVNVNASVTVKQSMNPQLFLNWLSSYHHR